jgi:hypothetical protein
MKEYDIVWDSGKCRNLVKLLNKKAEEGWVPVTMASPSVWLIYVLIEREANGEESSSTQL